jgi:hypothetical protein
MGAKVFGNFLFAGVDTMATGVEIGPRFLTIRELTTSAELDREK